MKQKTPVWVSNAIWLLCLVLIAFFLGQFGSLYIKNRINVPFSIALPGGATQEVQAKNVPLSEYESEILPILGNSEAGEPSPTPSPTRDPNAPILPADKVDWNQMIVQTPHLIRLKGTVVGSGDGIAFININGEDMTLSIAQKVGDYVVHSITKSAIYFKKGTEEKMIALYLEEGEPPAPAAPAPPEDPAVSPEMGREDDLDNIISFQGNSRIVDRRKFNALLKPPSRLANDIKFIPNSKDGKPYGIKISYLKPGSFFTKIGVQSGDVLIKTNNKDLQTVEDSFYAYQAFKNEEHLTLEIDRNGSIVKIPIEFR